MTTHLTPRKLILIIVTGLALLLLIALTDPGFAEAAPDAPDWYFQAAVQANCAEDNMSAEIGWTFWNRDSRTMRITVSLPDGTQQVRDVTAGAIEAGTFVGLALPLEAGAVRFDMRWIGFSGHDSATRSYGDVSCVPTALRLVTFGATSAGNRGGCNPESRVKDLACTVQNAGVGWVSGTCIWGEYFLALTARTFAPGQPVSVSGCVNQYGTIFSAPGVPLRVSRR